LNTAVPKGEINGEAALFLLLALLKQRETGYTTVQNMVNETSGRDTRADGHHSSLTAIDQPAKERVAVGTAAVFGQPRASSVG